jgi:hypothetical protein
VRESVCWGCLRVRERLLKGACESDWESSARRRAREGVLKSARESGLESALECMLDSVGVLCLRASESA